MSSRPAKRGLARTAGVSRDILPTVSCIFGDTGREVEDRNVKCYLYFAVHNRCLSCLRSRKSLQKTKDEIEQLMSLRRSIEKICVYLRRLINTLFT